MVSLGISGVVGMSEYGRQLPGQPRQLEYHPHVTQIFNVSQLMTITWDIAIPVLNEEIRLTSGINRLVTFLEENAFSGTYVISIADNGSTDRTEEVARELCAQYPQVRYLKVGKRGVGLALKAAWGKSTSTYVGYMDVDLATDLKHLLDVRNGFNDPSIQVVNASRLLPGSVVVNRTRLRETTSRGFNLLLKIIVGTTISDGMCGFKFIRRESWAKLGKLGWQNDGWFYCTEMVVRAEWSKMKIHEIAVHWNDDQESRVKLFRLIRQYLAAMIRLRWNKSALTCHQ